jgi:excisionase family DNA binding protein
MLTESPPFLHIVNIISRGYIVYLLDTADIPERSRRISTGLHDVRLSAKGGDGVVLLTVRAAAKRIGVHENTLRDWEERGIIKAVRLPTGIRRFPEEEVRACVEAIAQSLGRGPSDEPDPQRAITRSAMKRMPRDEGL